MRRREFVKAFGGLAVGFLLCDPEAIGNQSKALWKHGTSKTVRWVGRKGLWNEPCNWSNGKVPDENTDVTIGVDQDGIKPVVFVPNNIVVLVHGLRLEDNAVMKLRGDLRVSGNVDIAGGVWDAGRSTLRFC